jgi:hypothetical protein
MVRAMLIRRTTRTSLLLSAALSLSAVLAVGTIGCGGKKEPQTVADLDIKPGAMPDGGEWRGVYYNQLYGMLHITESGGAVQGAWRTEAGDKWGELYGEVEGDLLRYSWKEHKIGIVGPSATSEGKGFFQYTVPDPTQPHIIKGQWGLGEVEVGHTWEALKQLNQEPDPKSVRPDELEGHSGVEGFDGNKSDTGVDFGDKDKEKGEGEGEAKDEESKEKDEKAKK